MNPQLENLVADAVNELNENKLLDLKNQVKIKVNVIIKAQEQIEYWTKEIAKAREELTMLSVKEIKNNIL